MGQTAEIEVKNGNGYELRISSPRFDYEPTARLIVPGNNEPVRFCKINQDSVRIKIKGIFWGNAILVAYNYDLGPKFNETLVVNVRDPRPNNYHPTNAHHHEPVNEPDEWNKVCEEAAKDPNLGFTLKVMARNKVSPPFVAEAARFALIELLPPIGDLMAQWHFDYYLGGRGGVVNEDKNLKSWIEGDSNARKVISRRIMENRRGNESPVSVMFEFNQRSYDDDDARKSFGTIDNLEVAADFVMGTVEIWFEDTYEWHPPYSQYTKPFRCPDPVPRDTNFGHAALVQMKTRGAKDFQMRGKATFPMKLFPNL